MSTLCHSFNDYESGVLYYYDGKSYREWDYSEDQSGLKLKGDWTYTYESLEVQYTEVFHITENGGQWQVVNEQLEKGQKPLEFRGAQIRYENDSLYFQLTAPPDLRPSDLPTDMAFRINRKLKTEFKASASRDGYLLTIRYPHGRDHLGEGNSSVALVSKLQSTLSFLPLVRLARFR